MFRMVVDKLVLNLAEKNSFLCRCIGLLSNNYVAINNFVAFYWKLFFKRSTEENRIIYVSR